MVNQRQLPNSGAGKRLHHKRAHTAQAKHDHMALLQPFDGRLPQEHPFARKASSIAILLRVSIVILF